MARYRKVDPRIWNDAKFSSLSDNGRLVFFMLLTHPNMTALGAMRATQPGLAAEMGWSPEAFAEAFGQALRMGMAEHDAKACFVALPKFLKYNPPESPNVVKAWVGAVDLLPECDLKTLTLHRAGAYAEGLTEAFGKAFREAFAKAMPNQEQKQKQEQEGASSLRSDSLSAAPPDLLGNPAEPAGVLPADPAQKTERLAQITDDAIAAFNASPLVKGNGGNLSAVSADVGREKRQGQIRRCLRTARAICKKNYDSTIIPPAFWIDYWAVVATDDFRAGRQPGGRGHENWRPDFEYLTREDVMLKVYDHSEAEEPA